MSLLPQCCGSFVIAVLFYGPTHVSSYFCLCVFSSTVMTCPDSLFFMFLVSNRHILDLLNKSINWVQSHFTLFLAWMRTPFLCNGIIFCRFLQGSIFCIPVCMTQSMWSGPNEIPLHSSYITLGKLVSPSCITSLFYKSLTIPSLRSALLAHVSHAHVPFQVSHAHFVLCSKDLNIISMNFAQPTLS